MRVLRRVGGVHAGVHPAGARQVRHRAVDLRPVRGGGRGGDGEERREEEGGSGGALGSLRPIPSDRPDPAGAAAGRGHEGDLEEVFVEGEVDQSEEFLSQQWRQERLPNNEEHELHSGHHQGDDEQMNY